jgi:hypothetical protein
MRSWPWHNLSSLVLGVAFLCLTWTHVLRAEDRAPNSIHAVLSPPSGCKMGEECTPVVDMLTRPKEYKDEDAFYREYFAPTDAKVEREYMDRWRYHDTQINYTGAYRPVEHLAIGTCDTSYEADVRRQFAEQVMRMRMDAAVRTYFAPSDRAAGFKSAEQALNKVKSMPIRMGNNPSSGEMRFGYDVLSDASKLEYKQGAVQAGFYHPHLVGALSGGQSKIDLLSMRMTANPGKGLPSASMNLAMNGNLVEASIAKPLSPTVTTELLSRYPLRDQTIPCSYMLRLTYRF